VRRVEAVRKERNERLGLSFGGDIAGFLNRLIVLDVNRLYGANARAAAANLSREGDARSC